MMQLGKIYLQSARGASRCAAGKMNVYQKTKQKAVFYKHKIKKGKGLHTFL